MTRGFAAHELAGAFGNMQLLGQKFYHSFIGLPPIGRRGNANVHLGAVQVVVLYA